MAPVLPEQVLYRLKVIQEATGETLEQIWEKQSPAVRLAVFPEEARKFFQGLNTTQRAVLKGNSKFWGRPSQQIPDGDWFIWMLLAGRGYGKSWSGSNFVIKSARNYPRSRGALVGATVSDVRDVMILGDSGILANSPPDFVPKYEPSKRRLTWPNGSVCICYTADQPARLRGPNLSWAWCDELAVWRYPQEAWDMLMFCTRKGNPRVCVTTTPRPIPIIRQMVKDSIEDPASGILLTKGTTWENFWFLSDSYFEKIIKRAKGALARQEIYADIIEAVDGALFTHALIDENREGVNGIKRPPYFEKTVIGVDPAENDGDDNDATGIVAVARDARNHGWVLDDWSCKAAPAQWARRAYELFLAHDADHIVVETNRGGQMVAHTIRSVVREGEPRPRIVEVNASRGKSTRAEPIAALYEEGRFHHVGRLAQLEDEMCSYIPGISKRSPDRMDALVWAATNLFPVRLVNNMRHAGER